MKKRFLAVFLTAAMAVSMTAGCGSGQGETEKGAAESGSSTDDSGSGEITLKLFSNLPDRKTGQGLVEQMIIDEYMEENQNVTIEVEALDEEAYKTKFKAYSMEGMPDVVSIWGQPAFLDEVVDAGVLAELDQGDYADYKFIEGSLNGFTYDGKLYGLPRNTDVACIYYNQKMFEDNQWDVPETYDELLELAGKISDAGMIPMAMDGGDGWPMAVYLSDLLFQLAGTESSEIIADAIATGDFTDENLVKATEILKESADAKLFQNGYDSQDYATAMNLFTNGQAAMFYMGSWESSMALNEDIPEEIRENIRVFTS